MLDTVFPYSGGTTTTANGIVTTFPGDELRDIIVVKWIIVDVNSHSQDKLILLREF